MRILFYPIEKVRENRQSAEVFARLTRSKRRNALRNRVLEGRFLLDGPARSGNTFATFAVKEALGIEDFIHHKHTVAAIKVARSRKLPLYVLFRAPDDVALSNALYASSRSTEFAWPFSLINRRSQLMIDYYLYRWARYYQFALSIEDVAFFSSEELFRAPEVLLKRIAADLDRKGPFHGLNLSEEFFKKKEAQLLRQGNRVGAGIPNAQKEIAKKELESLVRKSRYLPDSMRIFERLTSLFVRESLCEPG